METNTEVSLPQAKEYLGSFEASRGKDSSQNLQRKHDAADILILDFKSPVLWENKFFFVLKHPDCDILSQQP